jgi:hypothetical protein
MLEKILGVATLWVQFSLPWKPSFPKWKADLDKAFRPQCCPPTCSVQAYGILGSGRFSLA